MGRAADNKDGRVMRSQAWQLVRLLRVGEEEGPGNMVGQTWLS